MSLHEKSAWACLISIALVYVPYFWLVLRYPMASVGLFLVAAFTVVALLVAFHIMHATIHVTEGMPPIDELDERIELQAAKWAGLILGFGIVTWVLIATYSILKIGASQGLSLSRAVPMSTAMAAVQWLFAVFVLANAVYYGAIVFRYRRLALA